MTGSTIFWYASRAAGIMALLLLTAVLVLGLAVTRRGAGSRGCPASP